VDGLLDLGILAVAVLAGLVVLYTVIRLGVRDGVLDARARDDAELAERQRRDRLRGQERVSDGQDDGRASLSLLDPVDDATQ
jgi:hypothetical protein